MASTSSHPNILTTPELKSLHQQLHKVKSRYLKVRKRSKNLQLVQQLKEEYNKLVNDFRSQVKQQKHHNWIEDVICSAQIHINRDTTNSAQSENLWHYQLLLDDISKKPEYWNTIISNNASNISSNS